MLLSIRGSTLNTFYKHCGSLNIFLFLAFSLIFHITIFAVYPYNFNIIPIYGVKEMQGHVRVVREGNDLGCENLGTADRRCSYASV